MWRCLDCDFRNNYANRQTCYSCDSPRRNDNNNSRDQNRHYSNQWICPAINCGFKNYNVRTVCFGCRLQRNNTPEQRRRPSNSRRPNEEPSRSSRNKSTENTPNEDSRRNRLGNDISVSGESSNDTTERLITGDGKKMQITLNNTATSSAKSTSTGSINVSVISD